LEHLLAHFVGVPIDEITVEDVDRFRYAKVQEGTLGATSINKLLATLAAILCVRHHPADARRRQRYCHGSSPQRHILILASGSFMLPGEKVATVKLHLSAEARKLLARMHVLRTRATIVAHDPAGATHTTQSVVTLREAKVTHRHG
jgi:hypothetical protein